LNKILIVRLGAMGDLIHALPAAAALRHAFPHARIDWAVDTRHRELLDLVPIIESTLNPYAHSDSGASGLWQLIPTTAKHYGVTIDWWYDGRRDPVDSTAAALDYLTYLHDEFGDWLLVFAAYNSGEGAVYAAMHRAGSTNFWKIQRYLPKETRDYVNKFIATCYYFEGAGSLSLLMRANISRYGSVSNAVVKK